MTDEVLAVSVGVLGSAVLAAVTWVLAFGLRRIHELQERILLLETRMNAFEDLGQLLKRHGINGLARVLGGGRRAR